MSEVDKVAEDAKLHSKMTKQEKLDSMLGKTTTLTIDDNGWALKGKIEKLPSSYLFRSASAEYLFTIDDVIEVSRQYIILESRGRVL